MTICPIALAVGCEKCPAFKFCPLTNILGNQGKEGLFNLLVAFDLLKVSLVLFKVRIIDN